MLRTKSGLPKHCCWAVDRHGKRRVRFRKSGFSTYLTGTPWSGDFMRQYAALLDRIKTPSGTIGADRTKPGTVNALAVAYYKSPDFKNLEDSTKDHRQADHGRQGGNAGGREQFGQDTPGDAQLRRRARHDREQSRHRHRAL
jgi:hypothetical protein